MQCLIPNTLCPMSSPLYEFKHKVTNVSKMFKNPWGQAVICTRVGWRQYMPVLGEDGSWHIVTRGYTSFLARQFLTKADDVQLQQPNMNLHYTKGEGLLTSLFDSSIAADEILEEIERTRVMNKVQESFSEEFASVEIHPSTGRLVTTDVDGKV